MFYLLITQQLFSNEKIKILLIKTWFGFDSFWYFSLANDPFNAVEQNTGGIEQLKTIFDDLASHRLIKMFKINYSFWHFAPRVVIWHSHKKSRLLSLFFIPACPFFCYFFFLVFSFRQLSFYCHWTRYLSLRHFDSLIAFNYKRVLRKNGVLRWMIININQFTISSISRTVCIGATFCSQNSSTNLVNWSLWPQKLPEICIFFSSFRKL